MPPASPGEGHEVWGIDSTPLAIAKAKEE